jgi:hypothetical protein
VAQVLAKHNISAVPVCEPARNGARGDLMRPYLSSNIQRRAWWLALLADGMEPRNSSNAFASTLAVRKIPRRRQCTPLLRGTRHAPRRHEQGRAAEFRAFWLNYIRPSTGGQKSITAQLVELVGGSWPPFDGTDRYGESLFLDKSLGVAGDFLEACA